MSAWRSLITGWSFRTSTPDFEVGQRIRAYLSNYDEQEKVGVARIGDTLLKVRGVGPAQVEQLVELRVTQFDAQAHRGEAERVE
ncbi:MAG: DUF7513 family protein [Phycisphaeraceae bacterium]